MQSNHSHQNPNIHIQDPLIPNNLPKLSSQLLSLLCQISEYVGPQAQLLPQTVPIDEDEYLMTFFLKSKKNTERTFYLGHGFGGSSLMYFPNFQELLNFGNILIWQMRGMGVSHKLNSYNVNKNHKSIKQFFMQGIQVLIQHFNHPKIVLISHSFSAFILMSFLLQHPNIPSIQNVILLSPIGFTPKALDYKNTTRSFSDLKNLAIAKFGWRFKLTFKSPMRTICCCLKKRLFLKGFKCLPLNDREVEICTNLFLLMIDLPDGSENLFFECFHPRVLPYQQQSIQELIQTGKYEYKYKTKIYYGGKLDWVDKQGAKFVSDKFDNVKVIQSNTYGHMMPLYPKLIKQIINQEFGEYNDMQEKEEID